MNALGADQAEHDQDRDEAQGELDARGPIDAEEGRVGVDPAFDLCEAEIGMALVAVMSGQRSDRMKVLQSVEFPYIFNVA